MTTVDEIKNHILFSGASKEDIKTFISERIENLSEEEVQKIHRLLQQWSKNSRPKTETIDGVIVKKAAL